MLEVYILSPFTVHGFGVYTQVVLKNKHEVVQFLMDVPLLVNFFSGCMSLVYLAFVDLSHVCQSLQHRTDVQTCFFQRACLTPGRELFLALDGANTTRMNTLERLPTMEVRETAVLVD